MEFFRIHRDIPFMRRALTFNVISAITFVFACLVVIFNLVADLLYGWLDPRISFR